MAAFPADDICWCDIANDLIRFKHIWEDRNSFHWDLRLDILKCLEKLHRKNVKIKRDGGKHFNEVKKLLQEGATTCWGLVLS